MNYNDKFLNDLKDGEVGEKIVANYLIENHGYKLIEFNKDKRYDLLLLKEVSNKEVKFEIKTDRWEYFNYKTNNMFIELECNGKVSGVKATEAKWFVYYFPEQEVAYIMLTSKLLELSNWIGSRRANSGDGGKVIGNVIKRDFIDDNLINKRYKSEFFNTNIGDFRRVIIKKPKGLFPQK